MGGDHGSPFPLLIGGLLPADRATGEDVKQRYRALCALIHPDKCADPRAREAFEYVNAANMALTRGKLTKEPGRSAGTLAAGNSNNNSTC